MKKTQIGFFLCFSAVVSLGVVLRLYGIEERPLHSDEGVNFFFLQEIERLGYYPYSHENYHGPLYFWLSYALAKPLEMSITGLRLGAVVTGTALIFLLLSLLRFGKRSFVLSAALLIAVSPSLVYYSRYGIHEMLFVFGGLWLAVSLLLIAERKSVAAVPSASLALACLIATKETFVITLAALGLSFLAISRPKDIVSFVRSNWEHFVGAVMLLSGFVVAFYSWALRNPAGISELFRSVPQWLGRGTKSDIGHFKPFLYYLRNVICPTEPWLALAVILLGVVVFLAGLGKIRVPVHWEHPARFFVVWACSSFLIYSFVPYKTAWLVVNITLPALLSLAALVELLLCGKGFPSLLGKLLLAFIVLLSLRSTAYYNYERPPLPLAFISRTEGKCYGPTNPFSYVHTSREFPALLKHLRDYWEIAPAARLLVASSHYWPLPYYLRDRAPQMAYLSPKAVTPRLADTYSMVILDKGHRWNLPGWGKTGFRLHDSSELEVWLKSVSDSPPPS